MRILRGLFAPALTSVALLSCAAGTLPPDTPAPVAPAAPGGPLTGFTREGATRQRALEARFDAEIKAADQRAWLEQMTAAPNHVGSPHNRANAELVLALFREWGWDARIETFQVLYPTPVSQTLELTAPTQFKASLREPPIAGDRTSDVPGALPPYLVYQGDGDVTAELVYVNYGMPKDYEVLAQRGVDVRGRIVIARYGGGWRGLKPQLAEEHGAKGCIIYSDPADDGYAEDEPYPKGGMRPPLGVQRGSVQKMTLYAGDPLTPGVAATPDAKRLRREDATTILKIPALPISYADAQPLLAALGGHVAPKQFRGALPITYHLGPGPARVHLAVQSDWHLETIHNVIAVMKGSERPDEWVIRGSHHDGWVFGASDPLAGHASLLSEAKAIGALARTGWRPRRTVVYASWDAEEPGMLGSTEWAEAHADELRRKAVLYVNSDVTGRGALRSAGSPSVQRLLNEVAADVRDPETGVSVGRRRGAFAQVAAQGEGATGEIRRMAREADRGADLPLDPIGSGSDYICFYHHLGVPSVAVGYRGEDEDDGVYHSAYDSFDHYVRFGDPGFVYGVALAQTSGRLVLRAAQAEGPVGRFSDVAATIAAYVEELKRLHGDLQERTETRSRLLAARAYDLAADPTKPHASPPAQARVPPVSFALLEAALTRLRASAQAFDGAYAAALAGPGLSPEQRSRLEAATLGIDIALLAPQGLPGRPWFRNLISAPGLLTGYGAKTLPGVREAIEGRRWAEAEQYIGVTAQALTAYADRLDRATAALR